MEASQSSDLSDLRPSGVAVIREVYNSENFLLKFEMELEHALETGCAIIIVEPERLADVTSRWISLGNALHRIAVYSGLSSIATGLLWQPPICVPFGVLSVLCTSCYTLSWQTDACSKYQQERNPRKLGRMSILTELTSTTPLVLVRKDNKKKIALHCTVTLAATAVCIWKIYRCIK